MSAPHGGGGPPQAVVGGACNDNDGYYILKNPVACTIGNGIFAVCCQEVAPLLLWNSSRIFRLAILPVAVRGR